LHFFVEPRSIVNEMEIRALTADDAAPYWHLRLEALQTGPFAFGKAAEEHEATTVQETALYRKLGFEIYGIEPRALKVGSEYVDETHMVLKIR
jgi:hypothetical protein